jgi:hypothetical protein
VFDFHVLKQWPAQKVDRKLGVNLGQVYFAKYKISKLMKKEIRKLPQLHGGQARSPELVDTSPSHTNRTRNNGRTWASDECRTRGNPKRTGKPRLASLPGSACRSADTSAPIRG